MKTLINAVKSELQFGLSYVREGDIQVVPHEDFLPKGVKTPFIGLKDGGIARSGGIDSSMEFIMDVKIMIWVSIFKPEASIIGDAGSGVKGVLEVADDVHEILDENLLSIAGMMEAFSPSEKESEPFFVDEKAYQQKVITYRYNREGDRP